MHIFLCPSTWEGNFVGSMLQSFRWAVVGAASSSKWRVWCITLVKLANHTSSLVVTATGLLRGTTSLSCNVMTVIEVFPSMNSTLPMPAKSFLKWCLYDLCVGGLTQDLKQVLITDEVVLWEGSSRFLREERRIWRSRWKKEKNKEEGDAKSRQSSSEKREGC